MDKANRAITKIAREVNKFTVRTLKEEGIGTSEFDVLHVIRKHPGTTQSKVCQITGLDKGAVARICANLETKGYLYRETDPSDMRSHQLYATTQAEALKGSKVEIETCFYTWLYEALSSAEQKELSRLLDLLYERCKIESKKEFIHLKEKIKGDNHEA